MLKKIEIHVTEDALGECRVKCDSKKINDFVARKGALITNPSEYLSGAEQLAVTMIMAAEQYMKQNAVRDGSYQGPKPNNN